MTAATLAVHTVDMPPSLDADQQPSAAERSAAAQRLRAVLERHTVDGTPLEECLPFVEHAQDEAGRTLLVLPFDPRAVSRALIEDLAGLASGQGGFTTALQVGEALAVIHATRVEVHGPGVAGAENIADLAARLARETAVDRWIESCDDDTLARIAADAPHRRVLDLADSALTDAGLVKLERFDELWSLDLGDTAVTDVGLTALASLTALRELSLDGCAVSDDGVRALAGLHELDSLSLAETRITDAALSTVGRLANLGELQLARTAITDAGLPALHDLEELEGLGLAGTQVTEAGIRTLRQRFPNLSIEH